MPIGHPPPQTSPSSIALSWVAGPGSCRGAGPRSSGEKGQYLHQYDVTTWVEFSTVLWGSASQAVLEEPEKLISTVSTALPAFPLFRGSQAFLIWFNASHLRTWPGDPPAEGPGEQRMCFGANLEQRLIGKRRMCMTQ